ncbi:MAG TPA: hypothetical protein VGQ82_00605 [Chthoniobacterales bacterium]|nr:hypothetical protein [Chthoniobacterales bacterium]
MKTEASQTLRAFLIELAVYAVLVVGYLFAIQHFFLGRLLQLEEKHLTLYAVVALGLIIGQAVVLELITTGLLRLLRGRSE